MKKAIPKIHGGKRAGSGRKPTGRDPVRTMRLSDSLIASVDAWAARNDTTRSEAIRRLVEIGLHRQEPEPGRKVDSAVKALADKYIERRR